MINASASAELRSIIRSVYRLVLYNSACVRRVDHHAAAGIYADMVHITSLFRQGKYKTMMAEVADLARRLKEIVYGVKG